MSLKNVYPSIPEHT